MSIKDLSRPIVIALLVFVINFQANAQDHLSKIKQSGELHIGMTGDQAPFCMKTKKGKLIGYEVDLANTLAESMGVELVLVEMPFSELLVALNEGRIDGVMSGMTITPERNMQALFAGPYMLSGKSMITKSQILAEISDPDQANDKNYKIACLKGSTSEDFVRKFMPKAEIVTVAEYDAGVDMVLNDQADAMVADAPVCMVAVLEHGAKGILMLDETLSIEPIGMALPSDDHQFLNLVENYMATMELSGALVTLESLWFEGDQWMINVE